MDTIKTLTELVNEELCDADKYAKLALAHKSSHPDLAEVFNTLGKEELKHMKMLHEAAVKIVEAHQAMYFE